MRVMTITSSVIELSESSSLCASLALQLVAVNEGQRLQRVDGSLEASSWLPLLSDDANAAGGELCGLDMPRYHA